MIGFTRRAMSCLAIGGIISTIFKPPAHATGHVKDSQWIEDLPLLPDISFSDADGTGRRLADFPGKAFLLNFWATWCPPCVAEMPSLDRLQAAVAPRGMVVLAISSERGGRATVEPFFTRHGLRHLGIWLDQRGEAARALRIRSLPTSIITDSGGHEVARVETAVQWDDPAVIAAVLDMAMADQPGHAAPSPP